MYRHSTDTHYRLTAIAIAREAGRIDAANGDPAEDWEPTVWAEALQEARHQLGLESHSHPETYGATAADEWSADIYAAYLAGYNGR